jgi:hypothetical protein
MSEVHGLLDKDMGERYEYRNVSEETGKEISHHFICFLS